MNKPMAETSRKSRSGDRSADGRMSGAEAVEEAKHYLLAMVGRPSESVSGLARTENGWSVTLDVVELERIPHTTDILGSYVVELDGWGDLLACQRIRRYHRNQTRALEE